MLSSLNKTTHLLYGEQSLHRDRNIEYMMELKSENLLLSHYFEAGMISFQQQPKGIHWGWDSPLSEIRGTVVGHWLSAASNLYVETGNLHIKYKADQIVSEIAKCQKATAAAGHSPFRRNIYTGYGTETENGPANMSVTRI